MYLPIHMSLIYYLAMMSLEETDRLGPRVQDEPYERYIGLNGGLEAANKGM